MLINLPAEVLLEIFESLLYVEPRAVIALARTCRKTYGIYKSHESIFLRRLIPSLVSPGKYHAAIFYLSTVPLRRAKDLSDDIFQKYKPAELRTIVSTLNNFLRLFRLMDLRSSRLIVKGIDWGWGKFDSIFEGYMDKKFGLVVALLVLTRRSPENLKGDLFLKRLFLYREDTVWVVENATKWDKAWVGTHVRNRYQYLVLEGYGLGDKEGDGVLTWIKRKTMRKRALEVWDHGELEQVVELLESAMSKRKAMQRI